jgi:hypothetical protein
MVLSKSVMRMVGHVRALPTPAPLWKIYPSKFYLLIALMMSFGFLLRFIGVPEDIRGVVILAVGTALVNGAMQYFRQAFLATKLFDH